MAEKRGQFSYNDDGTVGQLVQPAGDDMPISSNSLIPHDLQARLVNTAVTHTGVVVANGTFNAQTAWQPVPDGMSEFAQNLSLDAPVANSYASVIWSEDGTNSSGKTTATLSTGVTTNLKTSATWFPVGGAFYKAEIFNGDAAPRTCSANIKFRP